MKNSLVETGQISLETYLNQGLVSPQIQKQFKAGFEIAKPLLSVRSRLNGNVNSIPELNYQDHLELRQAVGREIKKNFAAIIGKEKAPVSPKETADLYFKRNLGFLETLIKTNPDLWLSFLSSSHILTLVHIRSLQEWISSHPREFRNHSQADPRIATCVLDIGATLAVAFDLTYLDQAFQKHHPQAPLGPTFEMRQALKCRQRLATREIQQKRLEIQKIMRERRLDRQVEYKGLVPLLKALENLINADGFKERLKYHNRFQKAREANKEGAFQFFVLSDDFFNQFVKNVHPDNMAELHIGIKTPTLRKLEGEFNEAREIARETLRKHHPRSRKPFPFTSLNHLFIAVGAGAKDYCQAVSDEKLCTLNINYILERLPGALEYATIFANPPGLSRSELIHITLELYNHHEFRHNSPWNGTIETLEKLLKLENKARRKNHQPPLKIKKFTRQQETYADAIDEAIAEGYACADQIKHGQFDPCKAFFVKFLLSFKDIVEEPKDEVAYGQKYSVMERYFAYLALKNGHLVRTKKGKYEIRDPQGCLEKLSAEAERLDTKLLRPDQNVYTYLNNIEEEGKRIFAGATSVVVNTLIADLEKIPKKKVRFKITEPPVRTK